MASHSPSGMGYENLFVVGIGASAGGLEALSSLVQRITLDETAFIVVQHLAPHRKSMLAELLARATRLRVVTVTDGMAVEANIVYVSPPNAEMTLHEGILHLTAPERVNRPLLPVDTFFRSLAADCGARAIGVVLSGTGSDGTFGLAAIKAGGGITFVQEPTDAKFDGMPRSALESGAADFSLPAEQIPDEIMRVGNHPHLSRRAAPLHFEAQLGALSALIKSRFGLDLEHYKTSTIERRLSRRMALHRLERVEDYLQLCDSDPRELAILHKDLLINVTSFFRDKLPFETLETKFFPRLFEQHPDGATLRAWVPGCSSGEEAYSIAICLHEAIERSGRRLKIQIFGTDVDDEALQQARRGLYPPNIAGDVSPERLRRHFHLTDDGQYQISRSIRDLVLFSMQNISRDAPISKLDLVSCRNLLIYFQPAIQQRVLQIIRYALLPSGILLLGSSEGVGEPSELFTLADREANLYAARPEATVRPTLKLAVPPLPPRPMHAPPQAVARPTVTIAQLADRRILEQYAPAGVVVNENLDILYFRGRTRPYLEQPSGVATHGLLRLIKPELHPPLRRAIDEALASGEPSTVAAQLREGPSGFRALTLVVQPLQEPETRARCLLILFKETNEAPGANELPAPPPLGPDEQSRFLAQELALTKDYLQSTIEELERTNEDLKSANEELQSSNEELQSTNEELETSKEELQSTNEELLTLNEELQNRMRDLGSANDDLHNILIALDRPLIIVGLDHRIRRFTVSAERMFDLLPADVGRSAAQLGTFLGGIGLEALIARAIETVATVEVKTEAADHAWYVVRIVPYKTLDLAIRGAVISILAQSP